MYYYCLAFLAILQIPTNTHQLHFYFPLRQTIFYLSQSKQPLIHVNVNEVHVVWGQIDCYVYIVHFSTFYSLSLLMLFVDLFYFIFFFCFFFAQSQDVGFCFFRLDVGLVVLTSSYFSHLFWINLSMQISSIQIELNKRRINDDEV